MKRVLFTSNRVIMLVAAVMIYVGNVSAQGLLRGVANAAKNRVEQTVVGAVTDAASKAVKGKKSKQAQVEQPAEAPAYVPESSGIREEDLPVPPGARVVSTLAAPVGGSMTFFSDNFATETVGQAPSKWNILDGEGYEVISFQGDNVLKFAKFGTIAPLMEEENYFPESFTIEFDAWTVVPANDMSSAHYLKVILYNSDWSHVCEQEVKPCTVGTCGFLEDWQMWYEDPSGETLDAECSWQDATKWMKPDTWTHFTLSYNRGDYKFCINDNCVISVSNMAQPAFLNLYGVQYDGQEPARIKNFVMHESH